jgi:hypothetical protein
VYQLQQQHVIPSFKAGDFGKGLQKAMIAVEIHIDKYGVPRREGGTAKKIFGGSYHPLAFGGSQRSHRHRSGGGGSGSGGGGGGGSSDYTGAAEDWMWAKALAASSCVGGVGYMLAYKRRVVSKCNT